MWCQLPSQTLQNATLAALVCSAPSDDPSSCVAICPNPDIAGVGVRSAFYLQSIMNTLLVIFSRRDSVPSAWASTLLTASLVIAAMVQKGNQTITLHHATLTMNFATLSCISSLAVAPTLSIWRLTTEGYYIRQLAHHVLHVTFQEGNSQNGDGPTLEEKDRARIQRAQGKQRLFLALALMTQVVLQWAWGIVLFVSPVYSQTNCSGDTVLLFFLARFTARDINHKYMVVWVFWLLFSLGITLFMTITLAVTSPSRARAYSRTNSRSSSVASRSSRSSARPPLYVQIFNSIWSSFPAWGDRDAQLIFWFNILATVLWAVYLISSELQIQANCIFSGENIISSFGQITALLLSAQPLWSLTVALYRWPATIERQRRLQQQRGGTSLLPTASPTVSSPSPGVAASTVSSGALLALPPRGRSAVVAGDRVPPGSPVLAVPQSEAGAPEGNDSTGVRLRPAPPAPSRDLNDVYIHRTSTDGWHELVSLTHLPRAPDSS
ncbi:hypothetical protein FKP32DRAFT_1641846 [Trametes sanguinea]|nr:hypothetical protein FKP32DRAFT_1641846 [Trametes sanguinea]